MGKRGPQPYKGTPIHRWTHKLAYAVGLITTDGCLSSDGRHIDFTSKDKDLVVTFRKCLGLTNRIGRKTSGYTGKKDYFRVQFGDVRFYAWLIELGLSPHKSKTLGPLKIPDRVFFHFLRGCFDGDGSIYAFWDPRWHSSYMFYTQFVSASRPHLEWLQHTIERLAHARGRIQKTVRAHQLVFAKAATRVISQKMYPRSDVPHLERKLRKTLKIFATDEKHNASPGVGTW